MFIGILLSKKRFSWTGLRVRYRFMGSHIGISVVFLVLLLLVGSASAQADEICSESGTVPSLDSPFAHVPYVYGKVILKGYDPGAKLPKVTVIFSDGQPRPERWMVDKSGNYCFRRKGGGSATLTVELDGIQVALRTLSAFGAAQQREDFEIYATDAERLRPPGVVSAKFLHPVNPKTVELYKKTSDAEADKDLKNAIDYLKEIVLIDPADFIAWAKLGTLYFEQNSLSEAESAFRKSLELRIDYTPSWINVGKLRVVQKQYVAAILIFKHSAELDPTSARVYQLLGEAYLQNRQGTLGAEALNEAIKLDPVGMAECHLKLAHLYELAGANKLATSEYKIFLTKIPDHPDKKRIEKFIKNNPE